MKKSSFLSLIVMLFVAAGCGSIPQENMDAVKAGVEAAKTAEANVYMPNELKAIQDSVAVVLQGIEAENSKFFKSFDAYKAKLETLKGQLDALVAEVPAKKQAVKEEALAGVAKAKELYAQSQELLAKAPKGKEGRAVLQKIGEELTVIEGTIAELETTLAGETNFKVALDKVKGVQTSISEINNELSEAIAKKAGK